MASGYSSTPLAKKLGVKSGDIIKLVNQPSHYSGLFTDFPENVTEAANIGAHKNFIHFFTTNVSELEQILPQLKKEIFQNGTIWVSWPKKASKITTDITENSIRDFAISIGLVDVKVCAVDDVWSGLKLVIPVKNRLKSD